MLKPLLSTQAQMLTLAQMLTQSRPTQLPILALEPL